MTPMTPADPIWFDPTKFWAATKNMPQEQADRLLNEVILKAEIRDLEGLRQFPFVRVGPHKSRPITRWGRHQTD